MRLFVAIDIDPSVRVAIEKVQQRLKRELNLSGRQVKWAAPEHIHLTLKFLGQVDDRDVMRICDAVTRTTAEFESFDFQVKGVGVFGRPARVVWAGISLCSPLLRLQTELDRKLTELGAPIENRPFAGHLTLCRVKNASAGRVLADAVGEYAEEFFGTVGAGEVVVYQSTLSSDGPEYSVVSRAALGM